MKRLLSFLFIACCFSMFVSSAHAQLIPLTETDLFGPLPGLPTPALASVSIAPADEGGLTVSVFSNPDFLQWGAVFDEFFFNVNPAREFVANVDASVGGIWQFGQDGQASRFGVFNFFLKGEGLQNGKGDPLIFHLHPQLQVADLFWNNDKGWSLAARLRNPLNQSSLYVAASSPLATPLPSGLLLMASGLGGLGLVRRRLGRS